MQNPSEQLARLLIGAGIALVVVGLIVLYGRFLILRVGKRNVGAIDVVR